MLRQLLHHPVVARHQQQRRRLDRAGILDQASRGVVQIEQNVDRDLWRDQFVGRILAGLLHVVREHLRLHITVDERLRLEYAQHAQAGNCQRHIELHSQCRRRDRQGANRRRIIVDPGGRQDGADALRHHSHVLERDVELIGQVANEFLGVADHPPKTLRIAAVARRPAVSAGVPREEPKVLQRNPVDKILPAARMLVPTMEQHHRAARLRGRGPSPIEQLYAVTGRKRVFGGGPGTDRRSIGDCLTHAGTSASIDDGKYNREYDPAGHFVKRTIQSNAPLGGIPR